MMKNFLAFLIVLLSLTCATGSTDAVNLCFSTLGNDFKIHIPALSFSGSLYTLDLDYSPSGPTPDAVWFKLNTESIGMSALTCSYPAPLFFDNGKFTLRLPMALYGAIPFWADLEYVPSDDGQLWFKVAGVGLMPNQMFVTSLTGSVNLGNWEPSAGGKTGLEAADNICQNLANAAGLQGTFKALLSDSNNDAYCRVHDLSGKKASNCNQETLPNSSGPWVRTDGFPFTASADTLFGNNLFSYVPPVLDESASILSGSYSYLLGTTKLGEFGYQYNCNDWTGTSSDQWVYVGTTTNTIGEWASYRATTCDRNNVRLLCLQTGASQPLPPFALPGKKVFFSSEEGTGNLQSWPSSGGNTGLAAADTVCQNRAAAAGLPNAQNFKAWLSDSSVDAKDRITSDGPWVRLDGVAVAESKPDLIDGRLFTSINLTETGLYRSNWRVYTGTTNAGLRTTKQCNNWSSNLASSEGTVGAVYSAGFDWSNEYAEGCSHSSYYGLYCFED